MSIEAQIAGPKPAGGWRLPRFPARWAVASAEAERIFARLLWLLVPLQYYVMTHMARGLSIGDLIPIVSLSLVSVVVIFILSCVVAWLASLLRPQDPEHGDTLTGRVKIWVVALLIATAAAYALLALSLAATHIALAHNFRIFRDLATHGLILLLGRLDDFTLLVLSNLVYSFVAILLVVLAHAVLRRDAADPAAPPEPGLIPVGLIVAVVMTLTNSLAALS
jgi:hypothetical protein